MKYFCGFKIVTTMKNFWLIILTAICMALSLPAMSQGETSNVQLASKYYQNGEYEKALTIYQDLYAQTEYKSYRDMYLSCLTLLKQYDAAEKFLKKEIKKKKNDFYLLIDLGMVYYNQNRASESEEQFNKAKELALANESSVSNAASAFQMYRQFQHAIDLYEKAQKKFPNKNYGLEIGNIYSIEKNYEQMMSHYLDYLVVETLSVVESRFVDLYITGSNAYLLSSEIATLLSGRYVEIKLLPLSFKEYVVASGNMHDLEKKYAEYITFSSFPYAKAFGGDEQLVNDYLRGIYSTIVLKDVMQRNSISDTMMLENVMAFLADNIGNTLSVKKIADTLTSMGRKVDVKTIEKYLSALCQSFILYPAKRYNIKGRQLLKTMEKYYLVDVALRNTLLGAKSTDWGHILENVVFLELLRRNNNVYIGKTDALEIDFITVNMQNVAYYQVAATVRDQATLERELQPLKAVKDNFPKTILTLDTDPVSYHDGIKQQNVLDWLLE